MKMSSLFLSTTLLISITCINLCAGGAGPANPQAKPLISGSSSLQEHSALRIAQQMFDGAPGSFTIESLEASTDIPEQVKLIILETLYQLCVDSIGLPTLKSLNLPNKSENEKNFCRWKVFQLCLFVSSYKISQFRDSKPEWLRLWFARKFFVENSADLSEDGLVVVEDIGGFPITQLMDQPWFPRPENGIWGLRFMHINNFTGFERVGPEALASLRELWLGGNPLTTLPPEIGKLTQLITLDLRGTLLDSVPVELGNLTNLRFLFWQEGYS